MIRRRGGPHGRRPPPAAADRRLLRRASIVVAAQTGIAVALVIGVIVALVYSISGQERISATDHKLQDKLAEFAPAPGAAIIDGVPPGCSEADVRAVVDELGTGTQRFEVCDTPFLAHVADAAGERVAAVTNFTEQQEETERLARLCVLVGVAGVLAAAGLGWLVARRAVRPLGDALVSQRRFVADASHELRTPLAILHTRAQLLQRRTSIDDDQRRQIDQLVDDARVLTDIVNDMLLSAEMQHRPEARQPVDLARVAAQVKDSFAATADEAGVDLVVDSVPEDSHVVTGVPSALRRAVAALVDNAMDHVARGGTITLGLSGSEAAGGTVRIAVTDDGAGLDPQLAAELTQRFRRGPGTNGDGHHPRLGLGLALVDEIVHAHDGTMVIDGRPGDGATVTLTFPAAT